MEMTFPLAIENANGGSSRAKFRTLISRSISRQTSTPTAQAIAFIRQNIGVSMVRDDTMAARASYFAGIVSPAATRAVPHGAFFPGTAHAAAHLQNYDHAVYQDGLTIRKPDGVEVVASENLAVKLGQEKLRSL